MVTFQAALTPQEDPDEHYNYASSNINSTLPLNVAHSSLPTPCHGLQTSIPVIPNVSSANHLSGYRGHADNSTAGYYLPPSVRPNGVPALESPRIEITYLGLHQNNNQFFHEAEVDESTQNTKRSPSTATLNLPNIEAYRDPSCLKTSPWQSPCVSPKTNETEERYQRSLVPCTLLNSPRHSPSTSPRTSITEENWLSSHNSRPSSPCNKRKYSLNGRQTSYSPHHSPTPSPQNSPRVSVTDETWLGNTNQYTSSAIVAAINALTTDSTIDMNDGIPIKSRKTAADHTPSMALKTEPSGDDQGTISPITDLSPEEFPGFQHIRKGNFCDQYLSVPQHSYHPSLPALDWQLPSHSGPYELRIEVQPKSHHRAHYETEGSRGAVKASAGGHPVVQVIALFLAACVFLLKPTSLISE
uniref:RHD domain-containing protein n=1 Tax=Laticauda laticaudata TaxID=8630 RepID=A0A8C5WU68_LATLA